MRFKAGEIVKFSNEFLELGKRQGITSWIRKVDHLIDKPLTIVYINHGSYGIVEDMGFGYLDSWFEYYEEPFELELEIGDFLI